jgi:hypothetical protein
VKQVASLTVKWHLHSEDERIVRQRLEEMDKFLIEGRISSMETAGNWSGS